MSSPSTTTDESSPGSTRVFVPILVAAVLLVAAVAFVLRSDPVERTEPLGVIAQAPAFSLTERSGRTVTNEDLRGHIWVADFFFTSCAGPCPEMSLRMRSLQKAVLEEGLPVTLVSVSIDPEYDRPGVLRRYADKYGADKDRWLFLTGEDQESVHEMIRTGFLIAVQRATKTTPLVHSTYFLLIDPAGRIRAVYEGLDPGTKQRVLADVRWLLSEAQGT